MGCWVDAGTLLALCRDGELLSWDHDIDLACWDTDAERLPDLARRFRAAGYKTIVRRYHGKPFKLKIRPTWLAQRRGARIIDLAIYTRIGDRAWSPGFWFTPSAHRAWTLRWLADQSVRSAVKEVWLRRFPHRAWTLPFPRMTLAMCTWSIPARFFERREHLEIDGTRVPVPVHREEYLAFRYGDWRTPDPDWDFYTQDPALLHEWPEKAIVGYERDRAVDHAQPPRTHDDERSAR